MLHASRWFLAGLFLWTAGEKLRDPSAFASIVENYRLLPGRVVKPAAWAMILADLGVGVALLAGCVTPRFQYAGPIAAAGMLAVFALAMAINLRRGRRIACGCGGNETLSWPKLAATLLLLPVALLCSLAAPVQSAIMELQSAIAGLVLLILHGAARQFAPHPATPRPG